MISLHLCSISGGEMRLFSPYFGDGVYSALFPQDHRAQKGHHHATLTLTHSVRLIVKCRAHNSGFGGIL